MRKTHFRKRNIARKTDKGGKLRNVHCRRWNMARKLKIMENEKHLLHDLKNDEITEKSEKWLMHTVGPGIWRENWKSWKMRNTHFRMWYMARKTEKGEKFRNVLCGTWNMARKEKIMENEKHPLNDLKNDEISEKREKWEMHTVGPGMWQETWKSRKMRITYFRTWNMARKTEKCGKFEMSTVGHGILQENWKSWKMRNIHVTTWKMTKSLKNVKNEKWHCRTWNVARKLKITENEKYTLYDVTYCEENRKRWKI
jgi:hypothetical protein